MRIGVPTEIKDNEYRVGMVPSGVRDLTSDGHQILVQKGAGHGAGRFEHVRQQRPARKRMQHLGQIRSHAFALAGRQDHQIHTVNLSFEKHHLAMARKRL